MITHRRGDIFEQRDLNAIAHQTNTFGHFGGGIAKRIKELFPAAWKKSQQTCIGKDPEQIIGKYDICHVANENSDVEDFYIFNCYSQENMGGEDRNTRYDPLVSILEHIRTRLEKVYGGPNVFRIGVPYGFGCGLAKGSWMIVESIFKSVLGESANVEIVVVTDPRFEHTVRK